MNQPKYVMQYSEESGVKAGGGDYISEGGAYQCTIIEAKYVKARTNSQGIEFSVQTADGLKANYLTAYYMKEDRTPISGGQSIINAIMGLVGLPGISSVKRGEEWVCPEFEGKQVGLFLQKRLYTKNDGKEGYEFQIRAPFDPRSMQTLKEKVSGKAAESISRWGLSYKDIDERNSQTSVYSHQNNVDYSDVIPGFDDDVNF